MCICQWLPTVRCDTRTKVIVIQDRSELNASKRRVSSIPILKLVMKNIEVEVVSVRQSFSLNIDFSDPSTAVLYPSEASVPLLPHNREISIGDSTFLGEYTDSAIRTLITIDGSWVTVQNIIAKNICLQPPRCRHVRLDSLPSESAYELYGLRKEPSRNFLSTAEAVAWALLSIEPAGQEASRHILSAFTNFVQLRTVCSIRDDDVSEDDDSSSSSGCQDDGYGVEENSGEGECRLLPSRGKKERVSKTKSQKRKQKRVSESRKKRRGR
jgi:DTW domain-containing protein YfiP